MAIVVQRGDDPDVNIRNLDKTSGQAADVPRNAAILLKKEHLLIESNPHLN
ncbi:MAG: hypothetical protein JW384_00572 [Nitrosomonadaceae bacterium]|nr:hypothetical protein [Nitrosomonadaceae bacterium]